jgi:NAD(P)H-dependent FMN reductase
MRIPLLLGSQRDNSNSFGIAQWLVSRAIIAGTQLSLDSSIPVPYQSVYEPTIAAAIKNSLDYQDPSIVAWSQLVSSSPAVVILTPQYNWGYPGGLKNAIDHLFHEWHGKPVLLVTFGGRGGGRCAEQLKDVLVGGVHATLVENVQITLPPEFIRTEERVRKRDEGVVEGGGSAGAEGKWPEFLSKYEKEVDDALKKLEGVILEANKVKEGQRDEL